MPIQKINQDSKNNREKTEDILKTQEPQERRKQEKQDAETNIGSKTQEKHRSGEYKRPPETRTETQKQNTKSHTM